MAITALDAHTALLIIDLQNGIVAFPTVHPSGDIVERSGRLAEAFRTAGQPVVLVTVNGMPPGRTDRPGLTEAPPPGWSELVPELHAKNGDIQIAKRAWGAFGTTDLDEQLRSAGVTEVVITGIATSMGVESTARFAHEHGYNVAVAVDAITDMDPDAHTHTVTRILPALAETGTTDEVIAAVGALSVESIS